MQSIQLKQNVIVAVDVGSQVSGIVVITDGVINRSSVTDNAVLFDLIKEYHGTGWRLRVVIEDIVPYGQHISLGLISTIKFLGELLYRLKTARISFRMITRIEVKLWVYRTFPDIAIPFIEERIRFKDLRNGKTGELRKPSHVFVNDSCVINALRFLWDIPAERGKSNRFGLSTHSWQALAVYSCYRDRELGNKRSVPFV